MKLRSIGARRLDIPFNVAFRHAAAERSATQTLWVRARDASGAIGYGEACPREYVTSETLQTAEDFVRARTAEWLDGIRDVDGLRQWVSGHAAEIDAHPAAWAAVELALLDLSGQVEGKPVEALLGYPRLDGAFSYTAVIGDGETAQFEKQLAQYVKVGFRQFKIKLSGDAGRDAGKVRALSASGVQPEAVRADANNLWGDAAAAIAALEALRFPFFALEEPLKAADYAGMRRVAEALGTRIILDESLLRVAQLERLPGPAETWIANVRVSKQGGLLRSLEIAEAVRGRDMRLVVGAHVGETSLLTRAGLTVAHAARDVLVGQEGAFGTHLLARDVADPPIMFGPRGMLDASAVPAGKPGLGLNITLPAEPRDRGG